jgi:ribosomal protein S18 acetylase RimI-like enzyme
MQISITAADLEDPTHARGVLELLDTYAREAIGAGRPLSPDVQRRLIGELRARDNAVVLLALDSGRPVGVAVCFVGFSTFAARPLLNVHDLAVLPAFRGRGVGRKLLEAADARARELGCCKLTLEVRQDNDRALALYRRFGFGHFTPGAEATPTLYLERRVQRSSDSGPAEC